MLNKKSAEDAEKLRQRADYLRQQRDKLVEAKQRQREKQLLEAAQRSAVDRPRTSQAARGAMQGAPARAAAAANADLIEARKAIASRIREQVMGPSASSSTPPPPADSK